MDSKKKDLTCYQNCFIKINEKEKKELVAHSKTSDLIVTLGSRGAIWNQILYPTHECEVFDVSGAGDTFMAAMVWKYLATKSMPDSLKFANHCARIVVQKFGTYCLKKEDLE